jgi:hypothetical protein
MSKPALTRLRSATAWQARLRGDFELSCTAEFYFDKTVPPTSDTGKLLSVSQQNKFVAGLAGLCAVTWVLAAIHPVDRQAWILENVVLVLFVFALSLTHRHLSLSNASHIFVDAARTDEFALEREGNSKAEPSLDPNFCGVVQPQRPIFTRINLGR